MSNPDELPHDPAAAEVDELAFLRTDNYPRASIADGIRHEQLKGARTALFAGGGILLALSIINFAVIAYREHDFAEEFERVVANNPSGARAQLEAAHDVRGAAVRMQWIIAGGFTALAIAFLVLGTRVVASPVVAPVTGVILLLGLVGLIGILSPASLLSWESILMFAMLIALLDGTRAGIAIQKKRAAAAANPPPS